MPVLCLFLFSFPRFTPSVQSADSAVSEEVNTMMVRPPDGLSTPFFGQNHSYSVTFRGNGEAIVILKAVFSNTKNDFLKEIKLRVPKIDPKDVSAYQVFITPYCLRYKTALNICEQYSEPQFYPYPNGTLSYQQASARVEADTIVITLPQALKTNASGSIVLYFRGFGYARKNIFGAYTYAFESLKVDDRISNLQIGITTDSDLVLRGVKGNVNYRFTGQMAGVAMEKSLSAPMANSNFDSLYNQVGHGGITKTATNLQPLDSYTVKGSYADTSLRLYAKEILIGIVIVIICITIFLLIIKKVFRYLINRHTDATKKQTKLIIAFGLSVVSSLLIVGYTILLMILVRSGFLSSFYEVQMLITLLIFILSSAIYILFFFAPAIIVGIRYGGLWGMGTFAMTVLWVIGDCIFAIIFMLIVNMGRIPPVYQPMMLQRGINNAVEKSSPPETIEAKQD